MWPSGTVYFQSINIHVIVSSLIHNSLSHSSERSKVRMWSFPASSGATYTVQWHCMSSWRGLGSESNGTQKWRTLASNRVDGRKDEWNYLIFGEFVLHDHMPPPWLHRRNISRRLAILCQAGKRLINWQCTTWWAPENSCRPRSSLAAHVSPKDNINALELASGRKGINQETTKTKLTPWRRQTPQCPSSFHQGRIGRLRILVHVEQDDTRKQTNYWSSSSQSFTNSLNFASDPGLVIVRDDLEFSIE